MSGRKNVLAAGFNKPPASVPADKAPSAEELKRKIDAQLQQAKDAGYDVHMWSLAPEEVGADKLKEFEEVLSSRKWDGFVVGNGIRGIADYTTFFEGLVNASRRLAPETPMGFNTMPSDTLDAIKRIC